MNAMKMAVIGYGQRGEQIVKEILLNMPDVEVVAVCDEYEDRTQKAMDEVEAKYGGKRPYGSCNYMDILNHEGIDAVYVATSWETHVEVAIDALLKGIPVALEVGGAYSLESLWNLVHTQERTGVPLMFMENCCFDREELLATALVRNGKLGEIVHCHGAYGHYLAGEVAGGEQNRHYRLRNYLTRNCENYPTHELGPIAKLLDINRGNRLVSLVSVASKAAGMEDYINRKADKYPELVGKKFRQGDIVNTLITCADGTTISMVLDTTIPRCFYSREFQVRGTHGMFDQDSNTVFVLGDKERGSAKRYFENNWNNGESYHEKYLVREWKDMTEEQKKIGHGGMDAIEFRVFVDCLRENKPMPIDVYDAATWMCVTALSEASIAAGGQPQSIPDFTSGMWTRRERLDVLEIPMVED